MPLIRVCFAVGLIFGPVTSSVAGVDEPPTFNKDVAPILFDHCVVCHRDGEVAPMALTSYRAVRPWARAIKAKVVSREMPPWHADPGGSLEFKNDRRLSQANIDTIAAWADGGAPEGNQADLPVLPPIPVGWQIQDLGDPDAIIRMPVAEVIPASGELPMTNYYIPVPWDEPKYARALESKPGNREVTHHTVAYIRSGLPPGTRLNEKGLATRDESITVDANASFEFAQRSVKLTGYAPGKGYKRYPEGAGRVLPPEWFFVLNQHYQPTGRSETDQSELGLWFHDDPVDTDVHEVVASDGIAIVGGQEVVAAAGARRPTVPNIPPFVDDWKIVTMKVFPDDTTVFSLSPHAHLRGKRFTYTLVYPDGAEQILLTVPRYDFNWQTFYELSEPMVFPAGSKLVTVGYYDNSVRNRYNPSPDKEVFWAEQSWDEMFNPFFEFGVAADEARGSTDE
ncbi:MAG: hypothetical protein VYE68_08020 [Acidobacteriota bacterium]|nr:hypothetical protein [Acidobacteriota bacterium]